MKPALALEWLAGKNLNLSCCNQKPQNWSQITAFLQQRKNHLREKLPF